ncbi:unnamed protein product [Amoebophrya sp. A25]|nr:unnamed protein product [Amoebophrya sp. A25]|eukprot:GSA25T00020016001.1
MEQEQMMFYPSSASTSATGTPPVTSTNKMNSTTAGSSTSVQNFSERSRRFRQFKSGLDENGELRERRWGAQVVLRRADKREEIAHKRRMRGSDVNIENPSTTTYWPTASWTSTKNGYASSTSTMNGNYYLVQNQNGNGGHQGNAETRNGTVDADERRMRELLDQNVNNSDSGTTEHALTKTNRGTSSRFGDVLEPSDRQWQREKMNTSPSFETTFLGANINTVTSSPDETNIDYDEDEENCSMNANNLIEDGGGQSGTGYGVLGTTGPSWALLPENRVLNGGLQGLQIWCHNATISELAYVLKLGAHFVTTKPENNISIREHFAELWTNYNLRQMNRTMQPKPNATSGSTSTTRWNNFSKMLGGRQQEAMMKAKSGRGPGQGRPQVPRIIGTDVNIFEPTSRTHQSQTSTSASTSWEQEDEQLQLYIRTPGGSNRRLSSLSTSTSTTSASPKGGGHEVEREQVSNPTTEMTETDNMFLMNRRNSCTKNPTSNENDHIHPHPPRIPWPLLNFAIVETRQRLACDRDHVPIQPCVDAGMVPSLMALLLTVDDAQLRFELCWALTNISSGTAAQTAVVVQEGGLKAFLQLLRSPVALELDGRICDQCVWALGNLCGDGPRYRDVLLADGGMFLLRELCLQLGGLPWPRDKKLDLQRNLMWTMGNMCRGTPKPALARVGPAVDLFATVLCRDLIQQHQGADDELRDAEALYEALWGLNYLLQPHITRAELREAASHRICLAAQKKLISRLLNRNIPKSRFADVDMDVEQVESIHQKNKGDQDETMDIIEESDRACMAFLDVSPTGTVVALGSNSCTSTSTSTTTSEPEVVLLQQGHGGSCSSSLLVVVALSTYFVENIKYRWVTTKILTSLASAPSGQPLERMLEACPALLPAVLAFLTFPEGSSLDELLKNKRGINSRSKETREDAVHDVVRMEHGDGADGPTTTTTTSSTPAPVAPGRGTTPAGRGEFGRSPAAHQQPVHVVDGFRFSALGYSMKKLWQHKRECCYLLRAIATSDVDFASSAFWHVDSSTTLPSLRILRDVASGILCQDVTCRRDCAFVLGYLILQKAGSFMDDLDHRAVLLGEKPGRGGGRGKEEQNENENAAIEVEPFLGGSESDIGRMKNGNLAARTADGADPLLSVFEASSLSSSGGENDTPPLVFDFTPDAPKQDEQQEVMTDGQHGNSGYKYNIPLALDQDKDDSTDDQELSFVSTWVTPPLNREGFSSIAHTVSGLGLPGRVFGNYVLAKNGSASAGGGSIRHNGYHGGAMGAVRGGAAGGGNPIMFVADPDIIHVSLCALEVLFDVSVLHVFFCQQGTANIGGGVDHSSSSCSTQQPQEPQSSRGNMSTRSCLPLPGRQEALRNWQHFEEADIRRQLSDLLSDTGSALYTSASALHGLRRNRYHIPKTGEQETILQTGTRLLAKMDLWGRVAGSHILNGAGGPPGPAGPGGGEQFLSSCLDIDSHLAPLSAPPAFAATSLYGFLEALKDEMDAQYDQHLVPDPRDDVCDTFGF